MAFHIFDNADQLATFWICVITTPICILLIIFRFTTKNRNGRKVGMEDWFALVALFFYLIWVAFALASIILENGRNVLEPGALPKSTTVAIIKTGYVVNTFYPVNQTFAKLSILALYYRVFSADQPFVYMTYAVATLQILWFIPMFIERFLVCNPPAKLWNPSMPGFCVNSQAVVAATESTNSFIDFVMVGMAIFVASKLRIPTSKKLELSILFVLGGFSGVVGLIKIAMVYGKVARTGTDLPWLLIQMATSVICCCVPLHRSIIPNFHIFQTLRSTLFSSHSSKSHHEDSANAAHASIQTIGRKSSKKPSWDTEQWLPLNEASSTRELSSHAWADTESARPGTQEYPTYPRQTLEIHQTVHHRP